MPLFKYKGFEGGGKRVAGVIDADSYVMAKEKLHRQEFLITSISSFEKKDKEVFLDHALLLSFTRELSQLLHAGLPLYESLLTIEEKYRKHEAHPLFLDLCDRLKGGSCLSLALGRYPKTFDRIYLSMIQAGELSGSLSHSLEELTGLITRAQKLKKQLVSALAYPAFLGSFCFIVVLSLLIFVIPSMQELFEGRQLHPMTYCVLAASHFITEYGALLFAFFIILGVLGFLFFRDKRGKILFQKTLINFPLFKTLFIQAAIIRFCRSASVLLNHGVPLTETLAVSRKLMKNALLEQAVEVAEKGIAEGKKLSAGLQKSVHIPSLVIRMLSLAEETGKTSDMLESLANIYDENLEKDLSRLTGILQPALLILLGAVVGIVVLSILLPLTDVSSLVST